jgi:hypothetical protein
MPYACARERHEIPRLFTNDFFHDFVMVDVNFLMGIMDNLSVFGQGVQYFVALAV